MRQSGEGEKRGVQANHGGREPQGTGRGGSCNVARKGNEPIYPRLGRVIGASCREMPTCQARRKSMNCERAKNSHGLALA